MPVLATQHTAVGAQAFAVFFVKTIDWGFATTSSKYMRHYYAPGCSGCVTFATGLDNTAAQHLYFIGDRIDIKSSSVEERTLPQGAQNGTDIRAHVTAFKAVNNSGRIFDHFHAIDRARFDLYANWAAHRWVIMMMVTSR